MSWLFSRALVAEYLEGTCSDGAPFAPSNGNPTPQAYLPPAKMTAFSRPSRFGMTFAPLTDDLGEGLLTWFRAAFRARTSVQPGKAQESTASEAGSGEKWRELSVRYDPGTYSWRTHRCLWDEDLPESSVTLPKWGSMRNGVLWERMTLALPTSGSGAGLWPTPVAHDDGKTPEAHMAMKARMKGGPRHRPTSLTVMVKGIERGMWPTPCARDHFPPHKPEYIEAKRSQGHGMSNLNDAVAHPRLFPTPTASLGTKGGRVTPRKSREGGTLIEAVSARAMWPTPKANDGEKRGNFDVTNPRNGLPAAVKRWPTPTVNDAQNSTLPPSQIAPDNIPGALLRDGEESGGQLNPDWVEWLMNWPAAWSSLGAIDKREFERWRGASAGWWDRDPSQPAGLDDGQIIPRVASGTVARVDRLTAIGNGQVPQCAAQAWRVLCGGDAT